MKVLAFNNYDIGSIAQEWEAEGRDAPSQHLWGCPELQALGHQVTYLPYQGSAALKSLSQKTRVLGDLDLQKRVLAQARDHDVIYCGHQPTVAALAPLRRLGLLRTPVVAVGYQSPRGTGRTHRIWAQSLVAGLDHLLCLSDAMQADLRALGVPDDRMGQIRWGVDLRHYQFDPDLPAGDPHFVAVGKSFRDFPALIAGFPFDRARLTVLGAGKTIDAPIPDAAQGRLTIRSDWIDWREFTRILPGFHGMVLPIDMVSSRGNNAIGLTAVTEALAAGVPVLATDNPYIGIDLAGEGVGDWVAPGDPAAWTAAITQICDDPAGATTMRRAARQLAQDRINITAFAATLDQTLRAVA